MSDAATDVTDVDLDVRWIALPERFDAMAAIEVRAELEEVIAAGAVHVAADLSPVAFLDSAGLAALVRAMQQLRARGGDLVLAGTASPVVQRVLELTKFDEVFAIEPDLAAP